MSVTHPGGQLDPTSQQLNDAVDTARTQISLGGNTAFLPQIGSQAAGIVNLRARYSDNDTLAERSHLIFQQQQLMAQMAQAVHDALLPLPFLNFPGFQVADREVNLLARALADEMLLLNQSQRLPGVLKVVLRNVVTHQFGAIGTSTEDLGDELAFTPGSVIRANIEIAGSSRIVGDSTFGVGNAWRGSAEVSRAEAIAEADVSILMRPGSRLEIDGRAVLGVGAALVGSGTVAADSWQIQGSAIGPGQSAGGLAIAGALRMTSGSLRMEIGGTAAGTFDQVRFEDAVALIGGTIRIVPLDGFEPVAGTSLRLFVADEGPLDFSRVAVRYGDFGGMAAVLQSDGMVTFARPGLLGTEGDDALQGTNAADVVPGLAGNDRLAGAGGNDRILGLAGHDVLAGGAGQDWLIGGAGNDRLLGGVGRDRLDGGAGWDTADYSGRAAAVVVALDGGRLAAVRVGGVVEDAVRGVEHVIGGGGNDRLAGDAAANALRGERGNDVLAGSDGADRLVGGHGDDRLLGGGGPDLLSGAFGSDVFVFRSLADAGFGARRDGITDFRPGADKIDLSAIDADVTRAGAQGFEFIGGQAFSGTPGEIRYVRSIGLVAGDVNGDGAADFHIGLSEHTPLDAEDFLL